MAFLNYKNAFASQVDGSQLDLQRADLFKVVLELPRALGLRWDEHVEFAVEKFPFPDRQKEVIPIKYMQQTNLMIGADAAMSPVEIPVRYAFAQRTAEALEKWFYLIANPLTGGTGLTSAVKCMGEVWWMVPNQAKQEADVSGTPMPNEATMIPGAHYVLEGCWIKGLSFIEADVMANAYVNMKFTLQCDRWYPKNIDSLQFLG